jgi:hypothetical protein
LFGLRPRQFALRARLPRHSLRSLLALAGGVAAFAFSNAGGACDSSLSDIACEDTAGYMGLFGAAAGGVLGLLFGAVTGAASSGDSWTSVDAPVRFTPTVIRGVPGIAMRVEF